MIDFKLKDTPEGGDIEFTGSDLKLTGSWATMLYMGLFGGNTEAVTGQRNDQQIAEDFWANSLLHEDKPAKQNNSRTEKALKTGVIGYDAVRKVTEAAQKDLSFFQQFANIEVEVEEQGYHSIALNITVQEPGNLDNKLYQFLWDATEQELKGLPGEEPNLTEYEDFQFTGQTAQTNIIQADQTTVDQLEKVTFTAVNVPDGLFYYWQIEDGSYFFKRGQTVEHTFRNTGLHDVSLVVSDNFSSQTQYKGDFIEVNIGQYTAFIFDIDTTKAGATASNEFQLPFVAGGDYSCSVDWGDGNTDVISSYNQAETLHTYSSGGVYTVKITGTFKGWTFGVTPNPNDAAKMLEIKQWGDLLFHDQGEYFRGCSNMTISATDVPNNLNELSNFSVFFFGCSSITTVPNMNFWDTSNASDMGYMFDEASSFNQDISLWQVQNVTDFGNFLDDTPMSIANYDALLIGWEQLSLQSNLKFGANNLEYSANSNASQARQDIINNYGWTFNGDTAV